MATLFSNQIASKRADLHILFLFLLRLAIHFPCIEPHGHRPWWKHIGNHCCSLVFPQLSALIKVKTQFLKLKISRLKIVLFSWVTAAAPSYLIPSWMKLCSFDNTSSNVTNGMSFRFTVPSKLSQVSYLKTVIHVRDPRSPHLAGDWQGWEGWCLLEPNAGLIQEQGLVLDHPGVRYPPLRCSPQEGLNRVRGHQEQFMTKS